ncbi:hypothetical protein [Consotaella aegiceratis]|uniref:hypothetical protein n=1 Tax=Consotaella aegiceratis TaxID=3097961 RepID=UPI002F3EB0C1
MALRSYISAGRLIVSEAGYAAGPSLADAHKVFDSDWLFSGRVVASGFLLDPSSPDDDDNTTSSSADQTVALPMTFDQIPKVRLLLVIPSDYVSQTDFVTANNGRFVKSVNANQFVIGRRRTSAGSSKRYRRHVFYWVYSS